MNTIYLLKQIIDLIYEESIYKTKLSEDASCKLNVLEKELEEKNKEVARLYTENIKLENTVRQLEVEFELAANVWGEPVREPATQTDCGVHATPVAPVASESSTSSKKKTKPKMATQENATEKKVDIVKEEVKVENEVKIEKENNVEPEIEPHKPVKKDRRNYMREYQKEYRKKQREEKISMNV